MNFKDNLDSKRLNPESSYLDLIIDQALKEDQADHDITSRLFIPAGDRASAQILIKEKGIVCGLEVAKAVFKRVDPAINFQIKLNDGSGVNKPGVVAKITGPTRGILAAERTALNFLGHLSGIATLTSKFVQTIKPLRTQILDTRKTTPLLRVLEKYAVRCGGGVNHRFDLNEMVLIKDNHLKVYHDLLSLKEAVEEAQRETSKQIEVEVDTMAQFKIVLEARPDMILLDNMSTAELRRAVKLVKQITGKRPQLEASGGVNLANIKKIAQTGVDRISVGSLIHHANWLDFSLELIK